MPLNGPKPLSGKSITATVVQQGTWNGRDRVPALAVMGGGWQESVANETYEIPSVPFRGDNETGFRCIATMK